MVIYCETHPSKTLEKLNFQRISSEFTDIAVIVAGRHFSLHKSLLAAHSSLFCSVLKGVTIGQTPNINLDGVELEYFSRIIDFIYTAKLDITPENMEHLHTTAQFLQIQDVIDLCNQFKKQEKEALARQLADRSIKVESFIMKQNPATNSVPIQEQDESLSLDEKTIADEQVLPSGKSVEEQKNQVTSMMIEVYGSRDGSFASEDTKLRLASPETQDPESLLDDADQGSKARKRGRKPLQRITCQICNKSFTRPKYEAHKRLHTGEKPFTCKTCNKQFVTVYNLKIHERIHTGERPYGCKFCSKTFADPSTVRKHILWHAGIKTKQCDICKKNFATMTQVREHRRSHTKEKPYECPECGKAYGYRCDLKRHMREHTGDLIGPCEECGKYFNHKGNFLSHRKSHARKASPQLKLQDSGLVTPDGRMILKAKFCDGMLVLPSQETTKINHGDVTMHEAITHQPDQSGTSQPPNGKLPTPVEADEIELTIHDRKYFVNHGDGDEPQIILKDEGLSAASTSGDQDQIFDQQCETELSADQVIMLVQHAQGYNVRSGSVEMVKCDSTRNDKVILGSDDETLVIVDGNAM